MNRLIWLAVALLLITQRPCIAQTSLEWEFEETTYMEVNLIGKPQNEGTVLWDSALKRPVRIDSIQSYELDMVMEISDKPVKAKGKGSDSFVIGYFAKNPDER